MFRFELSCALVTALLSYAVCDHSKLEISVSTLQSDLEYILQSVKYPTRANIHYTDKAVVQLVVHQKPKGQGLCIKIDGTLNIELSDGTIIQKSNVVYTGGSLGLPPYQDTLAHIIFKPDDNKVTPSYFTIRYISTQELTKDLREEAREMTTNTFYKDTSNYWPNFRIGSSTTQMNLCPKDGRFILKKPLKGILLHREEIEGFFDELGPIDPTALDGSVLSDVPPSYRSTNQPTVFFDVWYDPNKRRYGSTNGPLGGVEAVRIYEDDEWQLQEKILAQRAQVPGMRGEKIRMKVLEQDLANAYKRLYTDDPVCDNVVIDYSDEILLDVRRGSKGNHRYVTATGIRLDAQGGKPIHVRALYDLENLDYSNKVETRGTFVAETGERTFYLKYTDWGTFQRHMESVWTAMQGRCANDEKGVHYFNILYGEDIKVKYNCADRTLSTADTLTVLADNPKTSDIYKDIHKTAVNKCKNVSYQPIGIIEASCLLSGITPIAVQEEPKKFWSAKSKLVLMNAEMFKNKVEGLCKILHQKSLGKKVIVGTALLDDGMLFEIKFRTAGDFEINGNFTQKTASGDINYKKLLFDDGKFSMPIGTSVAIGDVGISKIYKGTASGFIDEYIIISDYLTIKGLKLYLRMVLKEALKRCGSKVNHLWFKLVRYDKFVLDGFCDCSKRFVSVEGELQSLLLKERDGNTEARSTGLINDLIYVEEGNILIAGCDNFHKVYAISVPELTDIKAAQKEFGGPVNIRKNSFVMFKFKED